MCYTIKTANLIIIHYKLNDNRISIKFLISIFIKRIVFLFSIYYIFIKICKEKHKLLNNRTKYNFKYDFYLSKNILKHFSNILILNKLL